MLDRVAAVATVAQVPAGPAGVLSDEKPLVVPLDGALHGVAERRRTLGRRAGMLGRVVAESDPGAGSQGFDRRYEVEVLGLTEEADGVAVSLATEAVIPAELGVDRERTRLFRVERAQADPAGADPAQSDVLGDQGDQVAWPTWSVRRLRRQYPQRKTKAA